MGRHDSRVIKIESDCEDGYLRVVIIGGAYPFFTDMRGDKIAALRLANVLETAANDIRKEVGWVS